MSREGPNHEVEYHFVFALSDPRIEDGVFYVGTTYDIEKRAAQIRNEPSSAWLYLQAMLAEGVEPFISEVGRFRGRGGAVMFADWLIKALRDEGHPVCSAVTGHHCTNFRPTVAVVHQDWEMTG